MQKNYSSLIRHPENMSLFKAVEMSILSAQNAVPLHIHAEGLRGTGKTTILRAAKEVLPRIERVTGCMYNCDPKAPHCPDHRNMDYAELSRLGSEWIPMPFLEISHSAKVATVVGAVDLVRLTDRSYPEAALLPGTLAQAHRGVVFVDEINRLADTSPELADVLLDVMGTKPGRLQIEEAGIPKVEVSSLVTIWAASNPDEDPGPLEGIRRQLADRFDLCLGVRRPTNLSTLLAILEQADTAVAIRNLEDARLSVSARLTSALVRLNEIELGERLRSFLARVYVDHGLESLRALEAIVLAAKVHASLAGKERVENDDLKTVIPMVLKHRAAPHVLNDILDALSRLNAAPVEIQVDTPVVETPGQQQTDEQQQQVLHETELSTEEGMTGLNKSFLSRLFGSLRERSDEHKPISGSEMMPATGPAPLNPTSGTEGMLDSSLADPETIAIIAPPKAAKQLRDLPEGRMVMSEEALRRDH